MTDPGVGEVGVEVAVGAVIVVSERLLLVQRAQDPGRGLWAVPGGRVQTGESLRQAVAREVAEETGLEVEVGDVAWTGRAIGPGDPPAWHFVIVDFWASVTRGEVRPGDDAAAAEWVPLTDVREHPIVDTMHSLMDSLWPNTNR